MQGKETRSAEWTKHGPYLKFSLSADGDRSIYSHRTVPLNCSDRGLNLDWDSLLNWKNFENECIFSVFQTMDSCLFFFFKHTQIAFFIKCGSFEVFKKTPAV